MRLATAEQAGYGRPRGGALVKPRRSARGEKGAAGVIHALCVITRYGGHKDQFAPAPSDSICMQRVMAHGIPLRSAAEFTKCTRATPQGGWQVGKRRKGSRGHAVPSVHSSLSLCIPRGIVYFREQSA